MSKRIEGQCSGCGLATDTPLCPACIDEEAVYRQWRVRHKRMPRAFVGYLDLLVQWKKRRDECRMLRKETEAARATAAAARQDLERTHTENAAAKVLLEGDAGALALEVVDLRAKLRLTEEHLERARTAALDAIRASYRADMSMLERACAIPAAMVKPLRSLCHPDRWQGTPQEGIATRVMQWLNGGGR